MDKKLKIENEIDSELKKLTIYTDTLCFDIRDEKQREAIKRAAALVKRYEKLG